MGLFWDLMQQNAINEQRDATSTLDQRVARLELELKQTRDLLQVVITRLEENLRTDLDRDGKIGTP
jgi:uncharacterized coiled-coil protein SlyX